MEKTPIRVLGMIDGDRLVFNESWDDLISNRAFIFSEEYNPVVFSMLYVAENVEKEKGYETIEEAFSDVEMSDELYTIIGEAAEYEALDAMDDLATA